MQSETTTCAMRPLAGRVDVQNNNEGHIEEINFANVYTCVFVYLYVHMSVVSYEYACACENIPVTKYVLGYYLHLPQ